MFLEERQEIILTMLAQKGRVKVNDLSKEFHVTEDCIRKDLASLEKKGQLKRVYGGAICAKEIDLLSKKSQHHQIFDKSAPDRIARAAVELIRKGDMVFLDISSSNVAIAEKLVSMDKDVTVVTNMIDVLVVLARCPKIHVIFSGGKINKNRDGFWGDLAKSFTSNLKPDVAFLGAVGIDVKENSVFTNDIDDGISKADIIKHSKKAYVVAESHKLTTEGSSSGYNYATLDTLSGLITDSPPTQEIQQAVDSYGVEIILSE